MLLLLFACVLWYSLAVGAPWLPTPQKRMRQALDAAQLQPGEKFVDLGCGDGRVCLLAARAYGARAIGVEKNIMLVWIARLRVFFAGMQSQVTILHDDIFTADVTSADVVFCFLLQQTNVRLASHLQKTMRPGARVVSFSFSFPSLTPIQRAGVPQGISLYEISSTSGLASTSTDAYHSPV